MKRIVAALAVLGVGACAVPVQEEKDPPPPTCSQRLEAFTPGAGTILPDPEKPFALPPLQTEVPLYQLTIPEEALAALEADPLGDTDYAATFVIDGTSVPVRVRYRGNSSREWPKKSWRIEAVGGKPFDGRDTINLLSEWKDVTLQVEKLAFDLLAAMGSPAPRTKFVRLAINGEYQGVYLDTERVDKDFLRNHGFVDRDASIYRCGRKDCEMKRWRANFQTKWEKKTNEGRANDDLETFLCAVNESPEPTFPQLLDQSLELESYLRVMATDALISNNVIEDSRSYVIHDDFTGRITYVPWDYNNSSTRWQPGSSLGKEAEVDHPLFIYSITDGWSEDVYRYRLAEKDPSKDWHPVFSSLSARISFHPELRGRLLATIDRALDTLFTNKVLDRRIEAVHDLLRPYVADDPYAYPDKFDDGVRYLKDYVTRRRAFLRTELERFRNPPAGMVLEALDPAAGLVTIRNRGAAPQNLSGWTLTPDLRRRPAPNLPAQTLAPNESLQIRTDDIGFALARSGELGLFHNERLDGVVDLLFYGELDPGERYGRSASDPAHWEIRR